MKTDPRQLAADALAALADHPDLTLNRYMDRLRETPGSLPSDSRDTAFFHALVYGILRWQGYLDHVISCFSKRKPESIDPPVKQILRIGLYQLFFMDRVPDSAAIHTSVELAKPLGGKWIAGFVNGVLRTAARKRGQIPLPSRSREFARWLSVAQSMPPWLVERWISRYGRKDAETLCQACNEQPPLTLRVNTLRRSRDELASDLSAVETEMSPFGLTLSGISGPITSLPGFEEGWFQVQDEAAQIASCLLAPKPGERVLDACAGLGGKTGHLAQIMENRGELIASDAVPAKLVRLELEMERLGVTCVASRPLDLNHPLPEDAGQFDRILVDAPCSGLGVLRRNPDGKWKASRTDLGRYAERQLRFLRHLAPHLRVGGRMVYAVCSMEPEEGHQVVRDFLAAHPDFSMLTPMDGDQGLIPASVSLPVDQLGRFLPRPDLHGMDGFFAAAFIRSGS